MGPSAAPRERSPSEVLSARARHRLEIAAVVAILAAAIVPRVRDLGATFDRGFDGWQGAFFAISAVNYERLGPGLLGGYPVQDIVLPADPAGAGLRSLGLYANHPPTVPLVGWLAVSAIAPADWASGADAGEAPAEIEPLLRAPFFAFHVLGLVAFWAAIRAAAGARRALLSLAVMAAVPVSILYAGLVNYENPALAFVLAGALFHVRYLRAGRARDAVLFGLAALAGCAITFFHLFWLPGFALHALLRAGWRRAAILGGAATLGALVPIVLHATLSSAAYAEVGLPRALLADRVREMLAPLVDGSVPLGAWLVFQVERAGRFLSVPLGVAALAGLALAVAGGRRRRSEADTSFDLTLPLFAGGCLVLLVMYRHTSDGWQGGDGQVPFVLHLVPGVAAAVGLLLDRVADPLFRLRGGLAPLVVVTSALCLPAIARANELRRPLREPDPTDPLPIVVGAELAELVEPGATAIYPSTLGFTPAHLFYAWRSMAPVDPADPAMIAVATQRLGNTGNDGWLVVPAAGRPEGVRAGERLVGFVRERVALAPEPDRETGRWRAWRLPR